LAVSIGKEISFDAETPRKYSESELLIFKALIVELATTTCKSDNCEVLDLFDFLLNAKSIAVATLIFILEIYANVAS
jgi:hypothetical protein